eukprot:gnl/TRDRNA2_/TRDRNA2_163690_c0_seq3.p1 gnl/TRDRNA2_/TRDRNA2_163690_c0~~gnl/TRDRNA2_/TRDRNA2_163690_c0_seq3.p1  ORF type:complete len:273 (+),score=64.91 gnl/TRDRNA2_/TRDRNA2_163690_c0_seq3:100-918(+)
MRCFVYVILMQLLATVAALQLGASSHRALTTVMWREAAEEHDTSSAATDDLEEDDQNAAEVTTGRKTDSRSSRQDNDLDDDNQDNGMKDNDRDNYLEQDDQQNDLEESNQDNDMEESNQDSEVDEDNRHTMGEKTVTTAGAENPIKAIMKYFKGIWKAIVNPAKEEVAVLRKKEKDMVKKAKAQKKKGISSIIGGAEGLLAKASGDECGTEQNKECPKGPSTCYGVAEADWCKDKCDEEEFVDRWKHAEKGCKVTCYQECEGGKFKHPVKAG